MDPAFALLGDQSYHLTCALNPDGEATGRGMPWTLWRAEHPARRLPCARPSATTLSLIPESPDPGAGTAPQMFRKTETRHPVVLFKFLTQICEQIASPLFSALMLRVQAQVMKPHALSERHTALPPKYARNLCHPAGQVSQGQKKGERSLNHRHPAGNQAGVPCVPGSWAPG